MNPTLKARRLASHLPPPPAAVCGRTGGASSSSGSLPALAALAMLAPTLPARAGEAASRPLIGPVAVIDGETLVVAGQRVVLHGIEAPHIDQTCLDRRERAYACGRDAAGALTARIERTVVACEPRGVTDGGALAALRRMGADDIAAWMVDHGHAVAERGASGAYASQDERAWARRVGLWSGVFQSPAERRRE